MSLGVPYPYQISNRTAMIPDTSHSLGGEMDAKNSGLVGLILLGILISVAGLYLGYLWIGNGSMLLLLGALIALVAGVTLTLVGFNAD